MSDIETIADLTYNNQQLLLKTTKFDEQLPYIFWQTGGDVAWFDWPQDDLKQQKEFIKNLTEKFFNQWIEYAPIGHNVKSIINVGSGLAKTDLLMSQLRPDIDFYLVDKTVDLLTLNKVLEGKNNYFSKSLDDENYHGFYNSFDITRDIIQNSPVNPERIHFLDPANKWPDQVDLIISTCSWMWHYHKNVYWDRLLRSLKIGGHLAITITLRNGENTIEEISNDLGSYPSNIVSWEPPTNNNAPGVDQITNVGYYVWQRMR